MKLINQEPDPIDDRLYKVEVTGRELVAIYVALRNIAPADITDDVEQGWLKDLLAKTEFTHHDLHVADVKQVLERA